MIMDLIWILLLPLLVPYLIGRAEQVLRSVLEIRNEKQIGLLIIWAIIIKSIVRQYRKMQFSGTHGSETVKKTNNNERDHGQNNPEGSGYPFPLDQADGWQNYNEKEFRQMSEIDSRKKVADQQGEKKQPFSANLARRGRGHKRGKIYLGRNKEESKLQRQTTDATDLDEQSFNSGPSHQKQPISINPEKEIPRLRAIQENKEEEPDSEGSVPAIQKEEHQFNVDRNDGCRPPNKHHCSRQEGEEPDSRQPMGLVRSIDLKNSKRVFQQQQKIQNDVLEEEGLKRQVQGSKAKIQEEQSYDDFLDALPRSLPTSKPKIKPEPIKQPPTYEFIVRITTYIAFFFIFDLLIVLLKLMEFICRILQGLLKGLFYRSLMEIIERVRTRIWLRTRCQIFGWIILSPILLVPWLLFWMVKQCLDKVIPDLSDEIGRQNCLLIYWSIRNQQ